MCGICGIIHSNKDNRVNKNILEKMKEVMIHWGPDEEGTHLDGNVGLGFRRLSIIDLGFGHQPMCNEDGTVWIVFNGEIYNHYEIRRELISRWHYYKTKCDTESIIHLYEEEGVEGLRKIMECLPLQSGMGGKKERCWSGIASVLSPSTSREPKIV